jgi:hypothetical protein
MTDGSVNLLPSSRNGTDPRRLKAGEIRIWDSEQAAYPPHQADDTVSSVGPSAIGHFMDTFIILLQSLLDMVRSQEVPIHPRIHVRTHVLKPSHNLFLSIGSVYWPKPS